ncbi:hypothetical protein NDA01_25025 [Trichocoleus desertorum AS-A10]|uniref:hypothetical protein n=1 Tax=Trichocoleus desertorum TaxID=1481672 RepID=UPI0032975EF7
MPRTDTGCHVERGTESRNLSQRAPFGTFWHNLRIMVLLPHLVKRSPPKNATTTICFCAIPNASRRVTVA